jgi:hypothetical protein
MIAAHFQLFANTAGSSYLTTVIAGRAGCVAVRWFSEARDLSGNRFSLSEVGCAGRRGRRRLAQIAPCRARSVIRPTARFRPGLAC